MSSASMPAGAVASGAGPSGLIIPHSAVVGNSLGLQQGTASVSTTGNAGSGSPSPNSGRIFSLKKKIIIKQNKKNILSGLS